MFRNQLYKYRAITKKAAAFSIFDSCGLSVFGLYKYR